MSDTTQRPSEEKFNDKMWRLDNLYFIQRKDRKKLPIRLKWAQRDFLTRRGLRSFILKSRRIGFSTACLIDMLDDTIHNRNTNSAIIAHDRDKVVKLFEIVKLAFEMYPEELKPEVRYDNRNELSFPGIGSKIYVTMDTRSETVHNLHISELAFIKDQQRITSSLESVPDTGKITFETTANGMSGYAFEEWMEDNSSFKKFFYPWYVDPDCERATERTMKEIMFEYIPLAKQYGLMEDVAERFSITPAQMEFYLDRVKRQREKIMQEYPTTAEEAFISSGKGVFHHADLSRHPVKPPLRTSGDLKIWEEPLPGFFYVLGVDPAEGTGNDNSVIEVFNANTGVQAAEYANNRVQADELATASIRIAKDYNRALIVPEINSPAYISHLRRQYDNIYTREVIDTEKKSKSYVIGWRTTAMSKKKLVEELEEAERTQDIEIRSQATVKEMTTFVRTDEQGKQGYGGEGANHDDRVIAMGLAVQGMKESPRRPRGQETGAEIAKRKLREWIDKKNLEKNFPGQDPSNLPTVQRRRKYTGQHIRGINR